MDDKTRRVFLQQLGAATGAVALAPVIGSCNRQAGGEPTTPATGDEPAAGEVVGDVAADAPQGELAIEALTVPQTRPDDWDPIAFNRQRGNAGAVPESYHESINSGDGPVGKHIPYLPAVAAGVVPEGYVAIMFGDPSQNYPQHPASAPEEGVEGHWYNWIRIRRATDGEAQEIETSFGGWPETSGDDAGQYAVMGGGDITADAGRNTIYLAQLPPDVGPGETIRVIAHCTLHGEYAQFLTPEIPVARS